MTPEGKVKAAVKRWLTARDIWYYMPMQNGFGKVGVPDFICCWKGKFFAIETKAPGRRNDLSENQKERINEIQNAAGWAIVVDDVSQLDEFEETLKKANIR